MATEAPQAFNLPPSLSLANKTAIVTGASRGIGAHLAFSLAQRGANVALIYTSDSSQPLAEKVAADIRALPGRKACLVQADMSAPDCGDKIVQGTLSGLATQSIELVVLNAAIGERTPLDSETSAAEQAAAFDRTFHTNVRGPALLVRALLPLFPTAPAAANRIVAVSSLNARLHFAGWADYSASKAALESLTRSWARELAAPYRLTANAVVVGPTVTERAPPDPVARERAKGLATAEARLGSVRDVAECVGWLLAPGSAWVNGDCVGCHGGAVFGA
ncbi:hypothetical protein SLS56_010971 [Neofusicoccum ribis]|uniref:NAD(P)-binding protein n=1 Tax=Neofusicoccum ribis TaxID=45134 RepID=A0ABR3SCY5_9PEZI